MVRLGPGRPSNPGLIREWTSEPVVDPVGPVGRCNGQNQFHDLFLVEVLTECVEVDVIDVARVAGQQVGEAQDSLLDWVEEAGVAPAAGLTQSGDLVVAVPSPPRRGGVRASSILAASVRAAVTTDLTLLVAVATIH